MAYGVISEDSNLHTCNSSLMLHTDICDKSLVMTLDYIQ